LFANYNDDDNNDDDINNDDDDDDDDDDGNNDDDDDENDDKKRSIPCSFFSILSNALLATGNDHTLPTNGCNCFVSNRSKTFLKSSSNSCGF